MPSFKENFDLERGDIIYGVSRSRKFYYRDILALGNADDPNFPYITIDQYNQHVPSLPDNDKDGEKVPREIFTSHKDYLEKHTKYSPLLLLPNVDSAALDPSQKQLIEKQGPKLLREEGTDKSPLENERRTKLAFRRSSKLGIEFVLTQTKAWIHFVLDHVKSGTEQGTAPTEWGVLNLQDLVHTKQTGPPTVKGIITGSELRYVFRHWNWIEKTGRLRFYLKGEEVPPPWEQKEWKDLWEEYAKYRHDKADRVILERKQTTTGFGSKTLGFKIGGSRTSVNNNNSKEEQ